MTVKTVRVKDKPPGSPQWVCSVSKGQANTLASGCTRREATERALRLYRFKYGSLVTCLR